jgi:hypothetical protein
VSPDGIILAVTSAKSNNIFSREKNLRNIVQLVIIDNFSSNISHIHTLVFEKMDANDVVCSSQCRLLNLTKHFAKDLIHMNNFSSNIFSSTP